MPVDRHTGRQIPTETTLDDEQLCEAVQEWAGKLAMSGGRDWEIRIPVDVDRDPDVLMSELAKRHRVLRARVERLEQEARAAVEALTRKTTFESLPPSVHRLWSLVEPDDPDALQECPDCGGAGGQVIEHPITRAMALDAGDIDLEGQLHEEHVACPRCEGDGWVLPEGKP